MASLRSHIVSAQYIQLKDKTTLRTAHGLPHVWKLLDIAADTAPSLKNDTLVVTEGWRLPRHPDDAHSWCLAFDLRIHNILEDHEEARKLAAWAWVKRMRAVLDDPRYQFDVHGEGRNAHIHMEFDPR